MEQSFADLLSDAFSGKKYVLLYLLLFSFFYYLLAVFHFQMMVLLQKHLFHHSLMEIWTLRI